MNSLKSSFAAKYIMIAAKAFNMIVLGGLLKIKPMVTLDSVLRGLKKTLPERHHHLIPMNEEAIKKGMELIQEMK
jgi:2-oxoglutarate ferredoxin oxidoreductase subunit gamma